MICKYFGCTGLTSVIVPNSVMTIGARAFYGCSGLTSITIPNSVTSIEGSAFSGCSGLTSVNIPNSVTSIGGSAFYGCSGLASIKVESGNTVYDSRNNCNAIIKTSTNELILGCKNTIIPNSVTSIGGSAFYGCSGLTSISIPNSVTSIEGSAFSGCSGLTFVNIPNSVTNIGNGAFYGCSGLTSITIPNSVTSIKNYAFYGCTGLIVINIGKDVHSIGYKAFANVGTAAGTRTRSEASTIIVNCYTESVPQTASNAFENTPIETGTLFVEDNLKNAFKSTSPWSRFGKIIGFEEAAGINYITIGTEDAWIFDMQGNRLDNVRKGVNIIRSRDGKTKKVMVK